MCCPLFINLSQFWYPDVVINRHDISGMSGYYGLECMSKFTLVLVESYIIRICDPDLCVRKYKHARTLQVMILSYLKFFAANKI